ATGVSCERLMGTRSDHAALMLALLIGFCVVFRCSATLWDTNALLVVNGSIRKMPETLFGVFFEEINHAGAGGLWAELVSNRGFESGGHHSPAIIDPWSIIGDDSLIKVSTEASSCFKKNPMALRMEVVCDNDCPVGGVGIYNPGYWGMECLVEQGHGFRNDLFKMVANMKPAFIRFPGGCFVEGEYLRNAFRWKETVGPWEERPGHFGDVWFYWTDDGLGHYEFFQLAEDLGAAPIWVFNNGISHQESVDPSIIMPFVQEALDGIEFARGGPNSTWGSVRAAMGHPEPFDLKYVAIGNEDCGKKYYRENYLKFYAAIRKAYPDIKMISNCDGSRVKLDHPADIDAKTVFSMANTFDRTSRVGPKAFVSEYAVTGDDAGLGSLLASLAEAGFLIGLEKNSDIVEMASYAPLFVNTNDKRWKPDAIVFDSSQSYGTPSYWMQHFFKESNGATLLNSTLQANTSNTLEASAIVFQDPVSKKNNLRIKVINFGSSTVSLKILIDGLDPNLLDNSGTKTVLTSANIVPVTSLVEKAGRNMDVVLLPHSLTCFDVLMKSGSAEITSTADDTSYVSSM
ncbi:hypothetical protein M8C21_028389, partial [Ambrosia artemisiifolia]